MNHLTLRTLFITVVSLGAAQASLASGCRWPCDPPFGRNGWQPANTAKAMPQTAAVQSPAVAASDDVMSARSNNGRPVASTPTLALKATAKPQQRTHSSR